jgi:hypothetical protein
MAFVDLAEMKNQDRQTASFLAQGYCPPCSRALALAGFTRKPQLCPDCELKGIQWQS